MHKLIVFLHGLNGDSETWGTVPTLVTSTLGSDYSYVCPEFSATKGSPATHERSADQVLTDLLNSHADKDLIFLVGYSDGGLIARAICRKLISAAKYDALTKKIAAAVTVGTPLEGIRVLGALAALFSGQLPSKLGEIVSKPIVTDGYADAIKQAIQRNVRRPLQYHIEIEADRLVAPHVLANYTADDRQLGTIPGGHRDFISTRAQIENLSIMLVRQFRDTESLLGKAYFPPIREPASAQLPDRLILLSCSNRKKEGGSTQYEGRPLTFLSDGPLRQRMLAKRTHVFRRLTESKIEDAFHVGSNRIHEAPNQALKYGPDFGGLQSQNKPALYLPAYQRYIGKSYMPIQRENWMSFDRTKLSVLIMSGLYGLIDSNEFIQEYDVHLTDTDIDSGVNLTAMWIDLYTQAIAAYVERSHKNRPVRIFDLLGDEDYVASVQWHKLAPDKCEVYHLTSKTLTTKQLLSCAGTVANAMLTDPNRMDIIDCEGTEHPIEEFGLPPQGISGAIQFEARVNQTRSSV